MMIASRLKLIKNPSAISCCIILIVMKLIYLHCDQHFGTAVSPGIYFVMNKSSQKLELRHSGASWETKKCYFDRKHLSCCLKTCFFGEHLHASLQGALLGRLPEF